MCFKYKCSNLTGWGTGAPPSEKICMTDENGLQSCAINAFNAVAGAVSSQSILSQSINGVLDSLSPPHRGPCGFYI